MESKSRRIETKTSRTAEMTCVTRAASFFEKNTCYKSNDYIAPELLPRFMVPLIKMSIVRNLYKNRFSPKGIYEYVIARTKYIDSIFVENLKEEFRQIVIFGAGFDSRGIRFMSKYQNSCVFELDAPKTQNAKLSQLQSRGVLIPKNIKFIPIDFNKECAIDKLMLSGFDRTKKTLFLLEGLLMYLDAESVKRTLKVISDNTVQGSEVVFDFVYSSVLNKEHRYYGQEDIAEFVQNAGEGCTFGIGEQELDSFLADYSLKVKDKKDSNDLEELFFKSGDGKLHGKINGTHCIVRAVV